LPTNRFFILFLSLTQSGAGREVPRHPAGFRLLRNGDEKPHEVT